MKLTNKQEMRVRTQLIAWFADSVSGYSQKELIDFITEYYGEFAIEAMANPTNLEV